MEELGMVAGSPATVYHKPRHLLKAKADADLGFTPVQGIQRVSIAVRQWSEAPKWHSIVATPQQSPKVAEFLCRLISFHT